MNPDGKSSPGSTSLDPFRGVEPKTITEIELEQGLRVQRVDLPAAARLTDLPWYWVLLAALVCTGASLVGTLVEARHLRKAVEESGLLKAEDKQAARDAEELVRDRERLQQRMRELKQRRQRLENPGAKPAAPERDMVDMPWTIEGLREEVRHRAGADFDNYRRAGTLGALVIGAFGLILLALFVR
ncbi:MAG: hypothetical protein KJ044_17195, partial [Planctomycetes bacterium]|nr:hypothetical protein [Planctomycetota bacterium]